MFPSDISHNVTNVCLVHAVSLGDCSLGHTIFMQLSNFYHVRRCKFRSIRLFAARLCAFGYFVPVIFRQSAKPEMGRIKARSIVTVRAVVTDKHIFRNRTIMDCPRNTMSVIQLATIHKTSITAQFGMSPFPTFIKFAFGAMSPKTFFESVTCGIIGVHKNLQFLCQAWDTRNVARHFLLGLHPHYTTRGCN